jgi:hypothetical protein
MTPLRDPAPKLYGRSPAEATLDTVKASNLSAQLRQLTVEIPMTTSPRDPADLTEFIDWLAEYVEKPLDPKLVSEAEKKDLPAKTLLSLGHGAALMAVTSKVAEILYARTRL